MLATIPSSALADDAPDDWQWALTVYAWLPGLSGDTSFPSSPGGGGYAFHWGELTGVWRYLDHDLGSDSAIQSLTLSGPAIGATFCF